jgi:hypothetical protein
MAGEAMEDLDLSTSEAEKPLAPFKDFVIP